MQRPETWLQDPLLVVPVRISHSDLPTPLLAILFQVEWTVPSSASLGLASGGVAIDRTAPATNCRK